MDVLAVVVLGVVAVAAVAGLWALLGPRVLWRRAIVSRRVVVNLRSGRAVSGVLVRQAGGLLFLRESSALEPGTDPVPMDGEAVVMVSEVDFVQAL